MNQDVFIEERKKNWERLDALLSQIRSNGIRNFTADELKLLGSLYRKTCSDLSYSRSRNFNQELVRYLNQLARRAYGLIYLSESQHKSAILKFLVSDFPAVFRKNFKFILFAAVIFCVSSVLGYIFNQLDSNFVRFVAPPHYLANWEGKETLEDDLSAMPIMSSFYWTNNFGVGMKAFVSGIFLGLGPLYVLIHNGLILGAISSMVLQLNNHQPFFSFVLSHSPIELMAIFVCGGAGFIIAWALISPGDMYRIDALNIRGKEALMLVLGTIPMFLIAGLIESSFSRLNIHIAFKIIFALATIILMVFYFSYDAEAKSRKRKVFKIKGV